MTLDDEMDLWARKKFRKFYIVSYIFNIWYFTSMFIFTIVNHFPAFVCSSISFGSILLMTSTSGKLFGIKPVIISVIIGAVIGIPLAAIFDIYGLTELLHMKLLSCSTGLTSN